MPTWTPQQQQAINARNNTILVSAAAGSGKTAVLVERIVQLIREGFAVDRMLIVTFTKAAAAEMRQRLNKRLIKEAAADPETMGKALNDLESTEISTIHAFCQKVLKNNFQAVGIDPLARPCDDQTKQALFDEAWLDAFNALLEGNDDPDFLDLANAWDEKNLREMTAQLYDFLMSLPAPMDWLDRKAAQIGEKPYHLQPWYRVLWTHARLELTGIGEILLAMEAMFAEPNAVEIRRETLLADNIAYTRLIEDARLYENDGGQVETLLAALDGFEMAKVKVARNTSDEEKAWLNRFKKQRDAIADIVKRTKERLSLDDERLDREFTRMRSHMSGLASLTKATHAAFLQKKAARHVIDFSDMEQFTMDILSDPACRAQMQAEYDHIFVDECQDVSQIQDAILQSIHNEHNCMFMVGDVKQSIYRFRKADPTLFLYRMQHFSDEEDAKTRRIFLQKNFRSRENVLGATNEVFRVVMRPAVTELNYAPEDELICGRETENDPAVEFHLLDMSAGEEGEAPEALEAEAATVVRRIKELLDTPFDDGGTVRNYTYRDMVILLAAASNTAPKLVEMLTAQGIPVFYDGAAAYYTLPEIQAMKALLSVIDNPMQDIPLLAALKNVPFSLTDAQIAAIRGVKTGKNVPFYEAFAACCEGEGGLSARCRDVRAQLKEWRFASETMRLSDFLWKIVQDSGFYAACGALPEGELRQANLRMLYQRAMTFEQNGGATLSDFLEMAEQQQSGDDRMSAKMLGEGENLVRIMTMHKSKGLEFPVVFCMQMSGRLHRPYRGELLMHTRLGLGLPYVDGTLRIKRKTILDEAFKIQRELDEKAERARLLYVAMTRARERLILVGCCKGNERDVWQLPRSDYAIWRAASMTDWVMQGISARDIHNLSTGSPQAQNPWNIRGWGEIETLSVDKPVDKSWTETWINIAQQPMGSNLGEGWTENTNEANAPVLKTSVSAIAKKEATHDPLPLPEGDEDIESKRVGEDIVTPLVLSDMPATPKFLEEKRLTGAERGTLMHRALSLLPLDPLRRATDLHLAVKEGLHGLLEMEAFTAQELLMLNSRAIEGFYRSDLGQRMLASPNVRREWSFNLVLTGETLLQGVIDCCFEEKGEWVLLDYKTDRFEDEEAFIARYAGQIDWYARALETITGKRVKEKWLYALGKERGYEVTDLSGC